MNARDEILAIARKHDPDACWMTWNPDGSIEPDENCLLINTAAAVFLLDRYPDAYEDPNEPPFVTDHTRVVFPSLPI